jgi:modulator of FtsH protease HflK
VKEVAESAMRDIVGQSNIQPLLTGARQQTEQAVQKLMQDVLDSYGAGVSIDQVQLLEGRSTDAGHRRFSRRAGGNT